MCTGRKPAKGESLTVQRCGWFLSRVGIKLTSIVSLPLVVRVVLVHPVKILKSNILTVVTALE